MFRDREARSAPIRLAAVAAAAVLVVALAACGYSADSDSGGIAPLPAVEQGAPAYDQYYSGTDEAAEADGETRSTAAGVDASTIPAEDRLVIRNKSLRIEVEDVRQSVDSIREMARTHQAIITNVNVSTDDGPVYRYDEYGTGTGSGAPLSGWVTLRVPADTYQAFIDDASELGEIKWEGESTDDVTQEHVDLSARLKNLQSEEVRLREFFDAAEKVEEMLMIEQELNRVRGEIESMTAQIAYLERQAAMATVTIELSEPEPIVQPDGPDWGFARAVTAGLQLAANVVKGLIVVVIGALPLVAIALAVFFVARAVLRSHRKRQDRNREPDTV